MIKAFLLIFSLISLSIAIPCGQCLGKGAECGISQRSSGTCRNGLECRVLEHGQSAHCRPRLEVGDTCDLTINNGVSGPSCPANSICSIDTNKCTRVPMNSATNDGCFTDDDCASNTADSGTSRCEKGICKSDADCTVIGCPLYQYCDTVDDECKNLPVAGESCSTVGECWKSTCIADVCQEYFSGVEGADCDSNLDCEPGLECSFDILNLESKCLVPNLEVLGKTERIRWGGDCDPLVDLVGCVCHHSLNTFKFLVEENPSTNAACRGPANSFSQCLKNNNCYSASTGENSCVRRHCWGQYKSFVDQCFSTHPSRVPDTCSAGTFSLVILFLFLAVLFN